MEIFCRAVWGKTLIPVALQPEPANFNIRVREPGTQFLNINSYPQSKDWKNRDYWQRCLPQLYESYRGICAYSAEWIPLETGVATVDHYTPKSIAPNLAYEWNNYRLASLKLNSRKGNFQDVIDPFLLTDGNFQLDFPSLIVKPNSTESEQRINSIDATIKRLKLNGESAIKSRIRWIKPYCKDEIGFHFLLQNAPFIGFELQRQNLKMQIKNIMRFD